MMKNLYCFDFDGTLTKHDTLFMFLKYFNQKRYYAQFIKHIPLFFLYKIRLVEAGRIKKSFIRSILHGASCEVLQNLANSFFKEKFTIICRESAVEFLEKLDREKNDCLLVSASLDIWVKPFADHFKMELVSTKAKFENNLFTGDFLTKNCNGKEKVYRIQKAIEGKKYKQIIAFGDSVGDREMLAWADVAHYRFFH